MHGVSFEETATVFSDPLHLVLADPDDSIKESRFLIFGESSEGRLLVASYTQRAKSIRLISAREATRREQKSYEEDH